MYPHLCLPFLPSSIHSQPYAATSSAVMVACGRLTIEPIETACLETGSSPLASTACEQHDEACIGSNKVQAYAIEVTV